MKLIFEENYPYSFNPGACTECSGKCCSGGSGNIWLNLHEVRTLADFLGMNQVDFMRHHVRRVGNRLSLVERGVGRQIVCTFFDIYQCRCSVYAVRPAQCKSFPFWDHYRHHVDALLRECPGVILTKNRNDRA
jgi:Fe-S-cluster containining protein